MNRPDQHEKFVVPEHLEKVSFERDTKVPNAGTFVLQREDHTAGNLLRMQLLRNENVLFSGYMMPHPLEYHVVLKVQTTRKSAPIEAVKGAVEDLKEELATLRQSVLEEVERIKQQDPMAME